MQTLRDAYAHRQILFALTAKELKAQYRSMSLGFVWALVNPLVMVTVLSLVFTIFFGNDLRQPSRVVVALIPYNFVVYCLSGCSHAISGNANLIRKVRFPRQVLPLSTILTHLVHFFIQSTLIVAVLALFPTEGAVLGAQLLWLLPVLVVHVGLCTGMGLLVAALNVAYRDTRYVVESVLTVLFWVSPVIYDARVEFDIAAGSTSAADWTLWQQAYFLNPVAGILDAYRAILFHGTAPDPFTFGLATVLTLIIGAVGVRTFWIWERDFADLVA